MLVLYGAVMKKVTFAAALIFALMILMSFEIYFVNEAFCTGSLVVTVDSPQDIVYTSSSVAISISASDPANLTGPESVAYSLDGEPQVIIATAPLGVHSLDGSAVLSLPNGVHEIVGVRITWHNGTADGIFFSEPVHFTVDSPIDYVPTSPTPLPSEQPQLGIEAILGVAVTVAVVVIGLGLLVYLIKRK
jgi:hypothetical protein